jgi:serine/threonine-protein kinase
VQRFLREAQTAARLRSDHIVDVLDVGLFQDGTPFLVMELLEGEALSARIKRLGRLGQQEAATLVDHLLDGLGAAHAAGVIHRDIKPDNCFITQKNGRDHLKLLDFGISKVAGDPREMRMTKTGVVMGTPYYMAPEQARGAKEIDHRCDLYAAGAILYECVTGRVPFDAESVNELLFKIVLEPIAPPSQFAPGIEPSFESLVLFAMAREASARFQNAQAFRDALVPWIPQRIPSGERAVLVTPASLPVAVVSSRPSPVQGSNTVRGHAGDLGSGPRVIVSTPPPPGDSAVSASAMTAPIESNPLSRTPQYSATPDTIPTPAITTRMDPPSRATPTGLGMSATGPIRPSVPSSRRGPLAAVAVVAALAVIGGGIYVATRGDARPSNASGDVKAAQSADVEKKSDPDSKEIVKTAKTAEPTPTQETTASVASASANVTGKPAGIATGGKTKPTSAATIVTTKATGSAHPVTTTTSTGAPTGTAPRPIDTSL